MQASCHAASIILSPSLSLYVYICGNLFHAIQQMLFNYLGTQRHPQLDTVPHCLPFTVTSASLLCVPFASSLSYFVAAANWLTEPLSGCCCQLATFDKRAATARQLATRQAGNSATRQQATNNVFTAINCLPRWRAATMLPAAKQSLYLTANTHTPTHTHSLTHVPTFAK